MVIKTLALQIHKPSKTKRDIMDGAIQRYNRALGYLLCHTKDKIPEIKKEMEEGNAYLTKRITSLLSKELMEKLNRFGVQPFKDSLKLDYAMGMVTWLALQRSQKNLRYPQMINTSAQVDKYFYEIVASYDGGEISRRELERELRRIYHSYSFQKPLLFGRYAKQRDYCLLYDEKAERFYAKVYLMGVKSEERRGGILRNRPGLRYVTKDGGMLEEDNKHERYLVLPLSFGKKQYEILKEGLADPSIFKTARLCRKNGDYYLMVNVDCRTEILRKPTAFMGIVRGLSDAVYFTVTDKEGKLLEEGATVLDGTPSKNTFHVAAHALLGTAQKYNAQIITYRLGEIGDGLSGEAVFPSLTAGQFHKLMTMVSYKAELAGLAKPVIVSPRGLFYTCPRCGANTWKNRFLKDKFLCVRCGYAGGLEKTGSLNAARRLLQYREKRLPFYATVTGRRIVIENEILRIRFEAEYLPSVSEEFYGYIRLLIKRWNVECAMPPSGRKAASYFKKFIAIRDPKEEIEIINTK
ncbi:MAG: hypothetical protein VB082_10100 [Christensenella sp.]|nr:hypothetical protein [Christensenella sp.]